VSAIPGPRKKASTYEKHVSPDGPSQGRSPLYGRAVPEAGGKSGGRSGKRVERVKGKKGRLQRAGKNTTAKEQKKTRLSTAGGANR